MKILPRIIEARLRHALERQKSVLLLEPRQTGKTTLLEPLHPDLLLNFLRPEVRQRYERAPHLLGSEVETLGERFRGRTPAEETHQVAPLSVLRPRGTPGCRRGRSTPARPCARLTV